MIAFTMQMFEELIDAAPKLKTAYEAARGKVLEDELSRLVRGPFRDGRVFTKLKWQDDLDGREYETDAFVLIDRTALIFEAKAGLRREASRQTP